MLDRNIMKDLITWKKGKNRKPLILKWARQVWKSFIVKKFWENNFGKTFEINFQSNSKVCKIFEDGDISASNIIEKIEYFFGNIIDLEKDLLFFDEIQECPKAINSLKFFCEETPKLAIIWAWSYLWLIQNEESFPVWKVSFLSMYPLNFEEFLKAVNQNLYKVYKKINIEKVDDFYHNEFLKELKLYFEVWGMPEIIKLFLSEKNNLKALTKARQAQLNLIEWYKSDFSKYSGTVNAGHILSVYESIPFQLAKNYDESVNKFKFGGVIPKRKWFESINWPLTWLSKSRLIIKNFIANKAKNPIKWYIKENYFKVFFHDIWLLNASLETPIWSIINENLWDYKWYIVENFVAQELFCIYDKDLISWNEWQSEIEFLVNKKNDIIPIEVKSSKKYRRAKSLDSYITRYNPKYAYKLTAQNYGKSKSYETIPLYMIGKLFPKN